MKEIIWDKAAKKTVRSFSPEVKREIGTLLMILQFGETLGPPQSKAFKTIHSSAFELRVKDSSGAYRVSYVLFDKSNIFIPHSFTKKTQKTPLKEINVAKKRLERLINEIK